MSGETTSRLMLEIVSENVGLSAKAGFATAIMWPPDDEITWTPKGLASSDFWMSSQFLSKNSEVVSIESRSVLPIWNLFSY